MDISYYIKLLEENRNIVLTGAPGTGKTWLAKEIANKMNAEWTFVQFHPSYDYTDFVEGLRPIQDNRNGIVFERKDGVFKAFCKKAIGNDESNTLMQNNGKASITNILQTKSVDYNYRQMFIDALEQFKNEVKKGKVEVLSHKEQKPFTVTIKPLFNKNKYRLYAITNSGNEVPCMDDEILRYMETREYKRGIQTYEPSIGKYILENILHNENQKVQYSFHISASEQIFTSIYQSVVQDIRRGIITRYNFFNSTYQNIKIDEGGRIIYREDQFSPKRIVERNIKSMYVYCIENNIYNVRDYGREGLFRLISKVTNGRTQSLDYIAYGWLLQELLDRTKITDREEAQNTEFDMSKYEQVSDLPVTDLEDIRANVSHDNTEQTYGNAKFVFIIDEINRGELSKIFGELFYAIDPGYRGKDGLVKTQYQNLVGKDDAFADGFYVPENVYIIATMNDIDRSVESMDFAMRRRFMWIEVTPDDRSEMLYDLKDDNICREAIARMHSLNEVIAETDGLGKSFQIGPAYFLKSEKLGFNLLWRLRLEPLLREYLRGFRNAEEKLLEFEAAYKSHATDNDSSNGVQP